jgi:uncharacterized membrane protein YpjA
MKNLKEQNPIVLAFAIVGVCALLYGAWTVYHQHLIEQEQRAIISEPPQIPGVAQSLKSKPKPPPQ